MWRERWYVKKYGHKPGTKRGTAAGFTYKGKHWTQQPENKARLRRLAKRNRAATLAKQQEKQ